MPNYLVWHEHGEVDHTIESDGDLDVDRMEKMLDDNRNENPELQNNQAFPEDVREFYKLLEASEARVHEGTNVSVLQVVTRLMVMKSKYTFSNKCYNDIVKLIIDISPPNHNMPKDLYHCKKLVASCRRFETGGSLSRRVSVLRAPAQMGRARGRARRGERRGGRSRA